MALFESYERRIDQINAVLNSYGISSIEEAEKITKDAGLDVYNMVKGIQPICFENACWAYIVGAAIAIKKGARKASEAAAAIGEGLQAFCIPGSVADQRKVGLGHGNLGKMLLEEDTECFAFLAGHESFAAAEGAIGIAEKANKVRQKPLRVILNGLGKDAAKIISRINGFTFVETEMDYATGEVKEIERIAYSDGLRSKVNCYGANDVTEGVAMLAASLVFAVLSTLRRGERLLFLWNWGVLLTAINMLAFPLCYSLPLRRLTKRFVKSGSALAGYVGADRLRRSNCVILTDTDLFPPGTVSLNGLKIYGEESGKVISYAATMAHASQSGLSRLFDTLLEGEGGRLEPLDDLSFYEEGGVSGLIHGETVLFGTAAFCRKMHVTMPGGLSLKTGAFLAVDGTLIAIFAVKYTAAENVDWALHALKRSRITPVLAVRDGSITPALLKRKFGTDARAVYPTISTRLALSEKDGEHPYALLYREGLMPYAEIAVGSKRLVHAVRVATVLSLGSSAVSALLAFYLTFVGAYSALTPVSMLLYLLLWALAALIEGFWADRY